MYSIPHNIQQTNNITPNIQQIENIKAVSVPTKKAVSNNQQVNTVISNTEIKETVEEKPVKPTLTEYLNTVCSDAGDFEVFRLRNPEIDINKTYNPLFIKYIVQHLPYSVTFLYILYIYIYIFIF